MEAFKEVFNKKFLTKFSEEINNIHLDFDNQGFISDLFSNDWKNLELKQRMSLISDTLKDFLPESYEKSVEILLEYIKNIEEIGKSMALSHMFIPDYVQKFGLNDFGTSVNAMELITRYTSCEFAVRPFIVKYSDKMMSKMYEWSNHEIDSVRRLACEGCRPRLPWASSLPNFISDPSPILPIINNLLNDESLFVRKSVANNLNDISKDNPQIVIQISKKWKNSSKNTDWILKKACRTLLKDGNSEIMKLFGFGIVKNLKIENFILKNSKIKIGDNLEFNFDLINNNNSEIKLRLEYCLYYKKVNGKLSPKIYQISEKLYPKKSNTQIKRKRSFKIISTRKFYKGKHKISIKLNGQETEKLSFELI